MSRIKRCGDIVMNGLVALLTLLGFTVLAIGLLFLIILLKLPYAITLATFAIIAILVPIVAYYVNRMMAVTATARTIPHIAQADITDPFATRPVNAGGYRRILLRQLLGKFRTLLLNSIVSLRRHRRTILALISTVMLAIICLASYSIINAMRQRPAESLTAKEGVVDKFTGNNQTIDLNIRSAPDDESEKIGLAEFGSRFQVLEVSSDNKWAKIIIIKHGRPKADRKSSDSGWIYLRFTSLN